MKNRKSIVTISSTHFINLEPDENELFDLYTEFDCAPDSTRFITCYPAAACEDYALVVINFLGFDSQLRLTNLGAHFYYEYLFDLIESTSDLSQELLDKFGSDGAKLVFGLFFGWLYGCGC